MSIPLPNPLSQIPRYPLLYPHPSPIHPLPYLTTTIIPRPPTKRITLYAKREDHASPLTSSGNKYRKLEYIIPHILDPQNTNLGEKGKEREKGKRKGPVTTLVTEGAIQSNHTVQVTAMAKHLGLSSLILLHRGFGRGLAATKNKDVFLSTGNVAVLRLLGAEVRVLEDTEENTSGLHADEGDGFVARVLDEVRSRGQEGYWIPSGASLHPLGGVGYVRAAVEIKEQEGVVLGEGRRFDYIFAACGSGSTIGGLIAGVKLLEKMEGGKGERKRRVVGILVSGTKPKGYHEERVLGFARRAAGMAGLDPEVDVAMEDVRLDDRFVGSAYGVLDPETKETLRLVAEREGVMLDPVYTAKAMRGMLHWGQHGELEQHAPGQDDINVLFVHTGGQSALSAYADS